jgi:hypothetical protein
MKPLSRMIFIYFIPYSFLILLGSSCQQAPICPSSQSTSTLVSSLDGQSRCPASIVIPNNVRDIKENYRRH